MQDAEWRDIQFDTKTSVAITETIALTLLGILLGYCFMPEAPFFSGLGFSWLMLGPSLSGIRYGLSYALNSVLLIVIIVYVSQLYQLTWVQGTPVGLGLNLLFTAVIAGEFRNYWYRRIKRLYAAAAYLNERLSEVSHAFNMLKHSHDRLEQMVASRVSLRDSILSIRRQILLSHTDKEDLNGLGLLILRTLADLGSLQGASLHAMNAKTNTVNTQPVAYIGYPSVLDLQNNLLLKSLTTRKTVSLKLNLITQEEKELLLVIPLIDVYGKIFGVITVNKMPFRAFREDNIQLLSILGGYIGDLMGTKLHPDRFFKDENLMFFYIQSMRCMEDVLNYNLSACLLGIEICNPMYSERLTNLIVRRQRGLDQILLQKNKSGNNVALLILPLTDLRGVDGYWLRLKNIIKSETGITDLETLGLRYVSQVLSADKKLIECMQCIANDLSMENIFLNLPNE